MQTGNDKLIGYLKENPNATKATIGEALQLKGLPLFNLIKKLMADGQIATQGEGTDATYILVETVNEEPATEVQTKADEYPHPQSGIVSVEETVTKNLVEQSGPIVDEEEKKNEEQVIAATTSKATTTRNNKKFLFNDEELGKGGLARAIVLQYLKDFPNTNLKKLEEVFPPALLKRFAVFQTIEKAREISGKKYDRYFFKDEHVIKLKDKTALVISSQWTFDNIQPLIKAAKSLGYKIK